MNGITLMDGSVCSHDKKCTKCQGITYLSVCFYSTQCQVYAYIFEGSVFVLRNMNINMTLKNASRAAPFSALLQSDIPSCLLLLCSPAKEALMGVWRPISGVLAKFTSHLESLDLGGTEALPAPSRTPPSWSRSAVREPLSHQHLRNK